ncbi:MAG: HEAT repeat domain-containing protein, partial [Planctomycetota bacterium]
MLKLPFLVVVVCSLTVTPAAFAKETALPTEQDLIAMIQSDAAKSEKAIACKQLAVVGTEASVATLSPLLRDPELASWARIALQAIPGSSVDEALIEALNDDIEVRTRIGIANTLGKRASEAAVEPLVAALDDPDTIRAESAAVSLGQIGGKAAQESLAKALQNASSLQVRNGAAEGLILMAEAAMRSGDKQSAIE